MNFFDKTWRLLPRAVVTRQTGQASDATGPPLGRLAGDVWVQRPEWQSLQGLVLGEIQIDNGYSPHVAALALRFAALGAAVQTPGTSGHGCLLFDWGHAPDDMDSTAMLCSPDARLGRWPLWGDVQQMLELETPDGSQPWGHPSAPWNDGPHWQALRHFRLQWQGWLQPFVSRLATVLPLGLRVQFLAPLLELLHGLAQFEIALGRGLILQASGGTWLDHDGDEYGAHWASISTWPTHQSLAEDLWDALRLAWPQVAPDRFEAAWRMAGLDMAEPGLRRSSTALADVWQAYRAWWPVFQRLLAEGKR